MKVFVLRMTELNTPNTIDSDDDIEPTYLPDNEPFEWKWSIIKVKIFNYACFVGEIVSSILGLEDSIFQDVADSMTEEDWIAAEELNKKREEDDQMHIVNNKINQIESQEINDNTNNNGNNDNNVNSDNSAHVDEIELQEK